jgi:hypothetical protein
LRGARFDRGHDPALEHPRSQPGPQQLEHPPITHPPLDLFKQRVVVDLVKTTADVSVEHPLLPAPGRVLPDCLQRVIGRQPEPEPVAGREKVGFEDRLEHDPRRRHHHPVAHRGNPQRPGLPRPARLGNVNPPQRPRPILTGAQPGGEPVEELALY